jgi:hypothetical protein
MLHAGCGTAGVGGVLFSFFELGAANATPGAKFFRIDYDE